MQNLKNLGHLGSAFNPLRLLTKILHYSSQLLISLPWNLSWNLNLPWSPIHPLRHQKMWRRHPSQTAWMAELICHVTMALHVSNQYQDRCLRMLSNHVFDRKLPTGSRPQRSRTYGRGTDVAMYHINILHARTLCNNLTFQVYTKAELPSLIVLPLSDLFHMPYCEVY